MKQQTTSTLTYDIAAIHVKLFHLWFRVKKISDDKESLKKKNSEALMKFKSGALMEFKSKELMKFIHAVKYTVYALIDQVIAMEHISCLICDIFDSKTIKPYLNKDDTTLLNKIKKVTKKWRFVRNKLGGHIDSTMVEEMCKLYDFKGIFLSDNNEADGTILNIMLIIQAINSTRKSNDIFGRDLDIKKDFSDIPTFIDELNGDWDTVTNNSFEYLMNLLYKIGMKEKLRDTNTEDQIGLYHRWLKTDTSSDHV